MTVLKSLTMRALAPILFVSLATLPALPVSAQTPEGSAAPADPASPVETAAPGTPAAEEAPAVEEAPVVEEATVAAEATADAPAEATTDAPAEATAAAKKDDCAATCAKVKGLNFKKGPFSLNLNGQLRARGIFDSNRTDLLDTGLFEREYVTQRARLGAVFSHSAGASITLQLQDSRVWGEELNTLNDYSADGLDLHQAFAIVPIYEKLEIKLGRQEIVFDNARLVGNVGWVQRARAFDAVRMTYARERFDIDFFYALVSEKDTDGDGHVPFGADARVGDVTFGGIHTNIKVAEGHQLSLAYYNRANVPDRHYRQTVGAMGKGKVAGVGYTGELFFQFGTQVGESISAYLAALHLNYGLEVTGKPAFEVWFEYLSGDGGTGLGTFDTLYATNHKFYGEMDLFLNVPKNSGGLGLMDIGGRVSAKPHARIKTQVDLHILGATTPSVADGSSFGTELDFKIIGSLSEKVGVRFLYGIFLPGDALIAVKGVDPADATGLEHFAYLTVDLKL